MFISTVPAALRCLAEDLKLRASHAEFMDAQLQAADALVLALNKWGCPRKAKESLNVYESFRKEFIRLDKK